MNNDDEMERGEERGEGGLPLGIVRTIWREEIVDFIWDSDGERGVKEVMRDIG